MTRDTSKKATPRTAKKGAAVPKRTVKQRTARVSAPGTSRAAKGPRVTKSARARTTQATARSKATGTRSTTPSTSKESAGRPSFLNGGASAKGRQRAVGMSARDAREQRERHNRAPVGKIVARILIVVAALAAIALIAYAVLRNSPTFAITSIETEATEHVSVDDIQNLVNVESGTTLLNVDTAAMTASLEKNPWIASVSYTRDFPGTLKISITERKVYALVTMSSGSVAWYLGEGNVWMEPTKIATTANQSVADAALAKATSEGELLITGVPATVQPVAGAGANDEVLDAVATYLSSFSDGFVSQIVSFSATSVESISCILSNGVEVSLGSPTNISSKETVVTGLLDKYPGELTYINVRVPSNPSYRRITSDTVQAGSGATGSATDSSTSATTTDGSTSTTTDSTATSTTE